jgi:hypothetical protein
MNCKQCMGFPIVYNIIHLYKYNICNLADAYIQSDLQSCVQTFLNMGGSGNSTRSHSLTSELDVHPRVSYIKVVANVTF